MVKTNRDIKEAEWDCRDINTPHSNSLVHKEGIEDGLPNYRAQLNGDIRVTICARCHPRIPGHIINIEPDNLGDYFEYEQVSALFSALPEGYTGSGTSKTFRERIFRYAMNDKYNPYSHHAGKTLQISLGYQWNRDRWKPDDDVIDSMYDSMIVTWESAYSDKYG